jgi:predicted DNA-binding transcriptional regulator AlpA
MYYVSLLDRGEVCRFFGGTRPINPATLYRGIRKGRYPAPVKVGPGSSRWLRDECETALRVMAVTQCVRTWIALRRLVGSCHTHQGSGAPMH